MNEKDIFVLADQALKKVVDQIRDDQWSMEMPPEFQTRKTDHALTLREIINYHAYDDAWVPNMLTGKTMDEVGKEMFKGDLVGGEGSEESDGSTAKAHFAAIVETACVAVRAFPDAELDTRIAHLSFGDYPVRHYLWQINSFRGFRAHDIAKVIGVDSKLPDDLVQGLWDELTPHVEEWRKMGIFGPKIEVPEDAPLQDRLLGLVGRQP